jgi:hypothetical protein
MLNAFHPVALAIGDEHAEKSLTNLETLPIVADRAHQNDAMKI